MAFRERFSFLMGISMGKWPDFEYHVGKWLKYDRSGYNSSHPSLGSPLDLGNPWRPLATLGDPWRHFWKWPFWGKLVIFKHASKSVLMLTLFDSIRHQTGLAQPFSWRLPSSTSGVAGCPLPMRELYIEEGGTDATDTCSNTHFNIIVFLKT